MAVQRALGESTAVCCDIENAKDSAPWFESKGFENVNATSFKNGDVVIMAGGPAHPIGHVQVYNSGKWYSDFSQNGFYPYKDGSKPAYSVLKTSLHSLETMMDYDGPFPLLTHKTAVNQRQF